MTTEKDSFYKPTESFKDLRVLEEIEKNPRISQRELSRRVGVAVGMVNACLHVLGRKGIIKIRGENNRTITYHLTHKGVLHKAKLAVQWSLNTIDFYRQARARLLDQLTALANEGERRIILYGWNEIAEISLLVSAEAGIEILGIIEPAHEGEPITRLGVRLGNLREILPLDGESPVVVTRALDEGEQAMLEELKSQRRIMFFA